MTDQAIVKQEDSTTVQLGTLTVASTSAVVSQATMIAKELSKIVEERKVYKIINGKKFPYVEAWTTLGAMLGILPRERYVKELQDGGYEAYVELIRSNDGAVIGGASAICTRAERNWSNRDDYALRSMSITRATSKAFRLALSWIMTLSGYEPTPAEEMDNVIDGQFHDSDGTSKTQTTPTQTKRSTQKEQRPPTDVKKTLRPASPEIVKERIATLAAEYAKDSEFKPTEPQQGLLRYGLELCFEAQDVKVIDDKRHALLKYLTGDASTKNVTGSVFKAIVEKWLEMKPNPDGSGEYLINPFSAQEAETIVSAALVAEGQQELGM